MIISVIIPFYYGKRYMSQLIEMLNNNYYSLESSSVSMEVVFVNDSPSEPVDGDKYSPVFDFSVINNVKNEGIHKSRVNGLSICHGEYVLFLDQDDLIADNYIESQLKQVGNYDFVVCNGWNELQDGTRIPIFHNINHQNCCLNLDFHYGYSNPIVSPGQVIIRKSSIPQQWVVNIFQKNGADDHYLWLLMLESGKKGTVNSDYLYTHVSTGENTSLDLSEMCASNMELVKMLTGTVAKGRLRKLKRRALYYGHHSERWYNKLRYWDVGVARKHYSKLMK